MEAAAMFLIYAMTAVFLENAVFTRILGVGQTLLHGNAKTILIHGCSVTVIAYLSSILCYFINGFLYDYKPNTGVRAFLYLLAVVVVYTVIYLAWGYVMQGRLKEVKVILPLAAFNCAVLGTLILSVSTQHSFSASTGFALGTGIGYTLALFLIFTGRKRLELTELPRSFRGMPITLLYIGIVSLAIYGLIGHQLPT